MFNNLITFIKHKMNLSKDVSVAFVLLILTSERRCLDIISYFLNIQYPYEPHNIVLTFTKLKLSPAPCLAAAPSLSALSAAVVGGSRLPCSTAAAAAPSRPERAGAPDYLCLSLFGCGRGPRDRRV